MTLASSVEATACIKNTSSTSLSMSGLKRSKIGGWNIFCAKAAPLSLQSQGDREGIGEGGGVEGGNGKKKEAQEVET